MSAFINSVSLCHQSKVLSTHILQNVVLAMNTNAGIYTKTKDRLNNIKVSSCTARVDNPTDWAKLQQADKELKIYLRISQFLVKVKEYFPKGKFSSKGTNIVCVFLHGDALIPKDSNLTRLEREFGMVREVKNNIITWIMIPSRQFFAKSKL